MELPVDDPRATAITSAIEAGDVDTLQRLIDEQAGLASARIVDSLGVSRTLLHAVADWPGHRPDARRIVQALGAAGADVDARVRRHGTQEAPETALHWAASCDDVDVLDALLDAGADIEADGAVFTGGSPMSDAVVFAQWRAARRLLERGAHTTTWQAAALGLVDRVQASCTSEPPPDPRTLSNALWHACRAGQVSTAEYLLDRGADPTWVGHDGKTPRDVALESGVIELIARLRRP